MNSKSGADSTDLNGQRKRTSADGVRQLTVTLSRLPELSPSSDDHIVSVTPPDSHAGYKVSGLAGLDEERQ